MGECARGSGGGGACCVEGQGGRALSQKRCLASARTTAQESARVGPDGAAPCCRGRHLLRRPLPFVPGHPGPLCCGRRQPPAGLVGIAFRHHRGCLCHVADHSSDLFSLAMAAVTACRGLHLGLCFRGRVAAIVGEGIADDLVAGAAVLCASAAAGCQCAAGHGAADVAGAPGVPL